MSKKTEKKAAKKEVVKKGMKKAEVKAAPEAPKATEPAPEVKKEEEVKGTVEQLVALGAEMNTVMGLEPAIDVTSYDGTSEAFDKLLASVQVNAKSIVKSDEFSAEGKALLTLFGCFNPWEKATKKAGKKAAKKEKKAKVATKEGEWKPGSLCQLILEAARELTPASFDSVVEKLKDTERGKKSSNLLSQTKIVMREAVRRGLLIKTEDGFISVPVPEPTEEAPAEGATAEEEKK
jgi:hypothetical protein